MVNDRTRTIPNLKDLMDALYQHVAADWNPLGIFLHLPMPTLNAISEQHRGDPQKCLLDMLEIARNRVDNPLSWADIVDAVKFLGKEQLARELRDKYCH